MKKITKLLTAIGAASLAALSLSLGLCFLNSSSPARFVYADSVQVPLPVLSENRFEYRASEYDIADYLGYDEETLALVNIEGGVQTDVPANPPYTATLSLVEGAEWSDGTTGAKSLMWTITPKVLKVPTFTEELVYSGEKYLLAEHLNDFDPAITVNGKEAEATNAGLYRANLSLPTENDGRNYVWKNEYFNGTIDWQIQKAELTLEWDSWRYLYNGSTFSPRARIASGIVEADEALGFQDPRFIYMGETDKREAGSYKIEVFIGQTSVLYKNYKIAKDSETFYWIIKESASEVAVTVEWDLPESGGYYYDGEIHYPTVKALYREDSETAENLGDYYITYTGDWNKAKYIGTYTVGVEITAVDGTPLRVRKSETSYVIRRDPLEGCVTELAPYTVIFETNGGSYIESQFVKPYLTANRPTDPTKKGYVFGGWYTDEECLTPFDFDTEILSNTTIYAKWEEDDTFFFGCNSSISTSLIVFFGMLAVGGTAIAIKKRANNK